MKKSPNPAGKLRRKTENDNKCELAIKKPLHLIVWIWGQKLGNEMINNLTKKTKRKSKIEREVEKETRWANQQKFPSGF